MAKNSLGLCNIFFSAKCYDLSRRVKGSFQIPEEPQFCIRIKNWVIKRSFRCDKTTPPLAIKTFCKDPRIDWTHQKSSLWDLDLKNLDKRVFVQTTMKNNFKNGMSFFLALLDLKAPFPWTSFGIVQGFYFTFVSTRRRIFWQANESKCKLVLIVGFESARRLLAWFFKHWWIMARRKSSMCHAYLLYTWLIYVKILSHITRSGFPLWWRC